MTANHVEKPKRCPFCGSPARLYIGNDGSDYSEDVYMWVCTNKNAGEDRCGCTLDWSYSIEGATTLWNRRAK